MKRIAPSYYPRFSCIADACRHSCCVGWEIDIDSQTAAFYQTVDGEIGERLIRCIRYRGGQASFLLDRHEQCPFWNDNGLCDIILTLGEDALCQICRDHPRFRNDFSDRVEIGVGLCCEAAAQLILTQSEPMTLTVLSDDGEPTLPSEDNATRFVRRDALLSLAQDRTLSIDERERRLLEAVGRDPKSLSARTFWRIYEPLERLDDDWSDRLQRLRELSHPAPAASLSAISLEQLLVYFLYRHAASYDARSPLAARVAFAVRSVQILRLLSRTTDELIDLARLYSAEIEYSQDNLDELFQTF